MLLTGAGGHGHHRKEDCDEKDQQAAGCQFGIIRQGFGNGHTQYCTEPSRRATGPGGAAGPGTCAHAGAAASEQLQWGSLEEPARLPQRGPRALPRAVAAHVSTAFGAAVSSASADATARYCRQWLATAGGRACPK